mmetsp:Transcript_14206/g.44177  ORF Transcript_14206/g.44177 Transcript_14206/m.44177 type:complete len:114 (-) Transcript_14206:2456-2797(-)
MVSEIDTSSLFDGDRDGLDRDGVGYEYDGVAVNDGVNPDSDSDSERSDTETASLTDGPCVAVAVPTLRVDVRDPDGVPRDGVPLGDGVGSVSLRVGPLCVSDGVWRERVKVPL